MTRVAMRGLWQCHVAVLNAYLCHPVAVVLFLLGSFVEGRRKDIVGPSRRVLEGEAVPRWLFKVFLLLGFLLIAGVAALIAYCFYNSKKKSSSSSSVAPLPSGDVPKSPMRSPSPGLGTPRRSSSAMLEGGPVKFSLSEIQSMTNNFDEAGIVENAGHSSVHRGMSADGDHFAIKRAKRASKEGDNMFKQEVKFLSHVKHDSIVPFVGSCDESQEQILVFEYELNGSLSSWLRPFDERAPLSLDQRLSIACDVAEALRFMHSFTKPNIIHRDVKSDTILLDTGFKAKLGGLGLLKHLPGEAMRIRMARKKGYLDPEYFQTFKVTAKCDVFSFGVVLLEIITAKPPVIPGEDAEEDGNGGVVSTTLAQWALPWINNKDVKSIADPRLTLDEASMDALLALSQVAAACVSALRQDRPDMERVLNLVKQIRDSRGSG